MIAATTARTARLASIRAVLQAASPALRPFMSLAARPRPILALAAAPTWSTRRSVSTAPATPTMTDLEYHQRSEAALDVLVDALEALGDDVELPGFDVTYSSGVLTLSLGASGTYVLNKQPPNQQIWLSSPVSGPRRFDWHAPSQAWVDARSVDPASGPVLEDLLRAELEQLVDVDLGEYLAK
ncbi:frataxin [Allomyces macrogynus ATCC 38327]|uniref:ferroxidase n=1 Tax=Allomyces macrogynus (strain ATCC 38327) TaxID=578462 RepID=A0A0L0SZT4_ALLM3|nr:frataxin [Allomyces macrogynus ATCC 38327]|eukprot:KNE68043.1 frataxin [Allomyces macrogynus ATCC 38327]